MSEGDSEANDPVLHKGGVLFLRWIAAVLRAKNLHNSSDTPLLFLDYYGIM